MLSKRIARYKPYRLKHGSSRYWNLASDKKYYKALGEPPVRIPACWQPFSDIWWWWKEETKAKKGTRTHIRTDTNMTIERSLAENEKSILVPMCR